MLDLNKSVYEMAIWVREKREKGEFKTYAEAYNYRCICI